MSRGAPQNPATPEELEAKFDAVASPALPAAARARVIAAARDLDRPGAFGELMAALAPAGA